ncbi:MAG: HNH endonuclease [Bdellovibrionales bacterium]|nr:HNH endonuclease [Bdellovibrionales bacterium]
MKLPFVLVSAFFRWLFSKKHITSDGYVVTKSTSGKEHYEHRTIAEEILGRRLEAWEVVHYINGRRNDNRPSNLCVMGGKAHDRYHDWYDWVHKTYGKYPRRETQLKKLRESFKGQVLDEAVKKRTGAG